MIDISYMQNIYTRKDDNERRLHRSHVTAIGTYDSFAEFAEDFRTQAVHPQPATNKEDAYGWTPTLFTPSGEEDAINERNAYFNKRFGTTSAKVWAVRKGHYADDYLTLFCADLDNHKPDRPLVSIDVVEAMLKQLGLAYLLYTSFSHKPERHKVRIVTSVTRLLTPAEAFQVFLVLNYALNYQLDGSIYDAGDFLYGPPENADVRLNVHGDPLDVDDFLAEAEQLPEEAKTIVKRSTSNHDKRVPTAEEIANFQERFNSLQTDDTVTIANPKYFRKEWLELADQLYLGGSHWQTMIGLLTKAWLKSDCQMSRADLETIQTELDLHWCGYLSSSYSRSELARAIKDAMRHVGTPRLTEKPTDCAIQAAFERMRRNKRKHK